MAEKKEYVGVISERNRTRVISVEKGSNTHKLAEQAEGDGYFRGWKLANPSQVKKAAEEKKSVKNAGGNEGPKPTPDAKETANENKEGETSKEGNQDEPQSKVPKAPEPTPEVKKNKGGRPSKKEAK